MDEQGGGGLLAFVRMMLDPMSSRATEKDMQDAMQRGTDPKAVERNVDRMGRTFDRLGSVVRRVAEYMIARQLVRGIAAFMGEMFRLGSDTIEVWNKFTATFGDASDEVDRFLDKYANLMGLSKNQGREFAATTGAILQGMGFVREQAAQAAQDVMRMAGDLTSFHNATIEQTFGAIISRLSGEMEPLRRFGIVITENDVKMRALAQGAHLVNGALDQQTRAATTLQLIQEKMGIANGDLIATQDSLANKARRLGATWQDMKARIAGEFIPAFAGLVTAMDENKGAAQSLAEVVGTTLRYAFAGVLLVLRALMQGYAGWAMLTAVVAEGSAKIGKMLGRDVSGLEEYAGRAWQSVAKVDAAMVAMKAAQDSLLTPGQGGKLPPASAGRSVVTPPAMDTKENAESKLDKEIALLKDAMAIQSTHAEALTRLKAIEADLQRQMDSGSLSFEERVKVIRRLNDVLDAQRVLVASEYDERIKQATEASKYDQTRAEGQQALKDLEDELRLAMQDTNLTFEERLRLAGELNRVQEAQRDIDPAKAAVYTVDQALQGMVATGMTARQMLKQLAGDASLAGNIMAAAMKGQGKAILKELAEEARGRATWNIAMAIQNFAQGLAKSANPLTATQAAAHFAAAKTHGLAAVKWGLVGAGVGAMGGGGGGGGGGSAAGGTENVGEGSAKDASKAPPAIVNVYVDGFDPTRSTHQDLLREANEQLGERYGVTVNVIPRR